MNDENVTPDGEILDPPAVQGGLPEIYGNHPLAVSLARAEIDSQIATARAFPRSPQMVLNRIFTLASLTDDSAKECIYGLVRGGKSIRGASIRLAEIVAGQWGNCRVGSRTVQTDRDEGYVEAEGVFHDLETNTATTARVRRRITDKYGKLLTPDMIIVTSNAAQSIAKRNAILSGVPRSVWMSAYKHCEKIIRGDAKTMGERRDEAIKAFATFAIKPEQIYAVLGVKGIDEITLDDIVTLVAMYQGIRNQDTTVEEVFAKTIEGEKTNKAKLDEIANGGKAKEPPPKEKKAAKKAAEKTEDTAPEQATPQPAPEQEDAGGGTVPKGEVSTPPPASKPDEGEDPTEAQLAKAAAAGDAAYRAGKGRKAIPSLWNRHSKLKGAFQEGWDEAEASDPENNKE